LLNGGKCQLFPPDHTVLKSLAFFHSLPGLFKYLEVSKD
jgi:hypothetical protein